MEETRRPDVSSHFATLDQHDEAWAKIHDLLAAGHWARARAIFDQAVSAPTRTVAPHVDGQDFYELCQQYRHAKEMMPFGVPNATQAFNNLREYIKTGKLPWPSYEEPK